MLLSCTLLALSTAFVSGLEDGGLLLRGKQLYRKLYTAQQVTFVSECKAELGGSQVLSDKLISQVEFKDMYYLLCQKYNLGSCTQSGGFETLPDDVQHAFVSEVCTDMSVSCLESLVSIQVIADNFGYVVSSMQAETDNVINNVCVSLNTAVNGGNTSSAGLDLVGSDYVPKVAGDSNAFNVAGAATAGSALFLLLALLAGDRKKHRQNTQKVIKDIETANCTEETPLKEFGEEINPIILHSGETDEVYKAIDEANWGRVYNFASLLAEREDQSTMSSLSRVSLPETDRSHLSLEDQQRTRTLDRLAKNCDWTGVAVTAALYADENGTSKEQPLDDLFLDESVVEDENVTSKEEPLDGISLSENVVEDEKDTDASTVLSELEERIDTAADSGDWDEMFSLSSDLEESEDLPTLSNETDLFTGETVSETRELLNNALHDGDWALVGACANKMREMKDHPDAMEDEKFEEFSGDELDSDSSKKQTLSKLINAKKWKGVGTIAALYEMENKGCLPSPKSNDDQENTVV